MKRIDRHWTLYALIVYIIQSSLSVNNKMSSYQGSVEFDFNKESSDSESSETAEVIVEYDTESAILEESNAFDSEPEGPYMDEPLADDDWIAEYNGEVSEAEQRNQALQNRFDNIEGLDAWCRCGNCSLARLQNAGECLCCQEIEKCVESLSSDAVSWEVETTPRCVTMHPGFNAVCLNHWSLRSAAAKYKTIDGRKYRQTGSEQRFLRGVAYREFTQLVHGFLGQSRRR